VDVVTKIKDTYNRMEQNKEDSRVILERVEGCLEIVAEQTQDAQRRVLVLQHKYFQTALKNLSTCLDECPALLKTIATPASDCCAQGCLFFSASNHAEQISAYSQKLQDARDEFTKNMIPLMAEILKELAAQSAKAAEEARQLALEHEHKRAADVAQAAALANQHAAQASDSAVHIENKVDNLAEVISSALQLNTSLNQKALQSLRTFIDEGQHKQAHDKLAYFDTCNTLFKTLNPDLELEYRAKFRTHMLCKQGEPVSREEALQLLEATLKSAAEHEPSLPKDPPRMRP
jgi:methyl-accepting chemotaxis protein